MRAAAPHLRSDGVAGTMVWPSIWDRPRSANGYDHELPCTPHMRSDSVAQALTWQSAWSHPSLWSRKQTLSYSQARLACARERLTREIAAFERATGRRVICYMAPTR